MIGKQRDDAHLHDHDCLLHHIAHSGANELQQYIDTTLGRFVNLDCGLANHLDTSPHEIDVNFLGIPEPPSVSPDAGTSRVRTP